MGFHQIITNAARRLDYMFPGFFETSTKRNHYVDFGYPENVTFPQLWQMYRRNGIAKAAVEKTIGKTWEDNPVLKTDAEADELTPAEEEVAERFKDLRFWQALAEADRRSLVGRYAAVILRFADGRLMREPVESVPGGLDGLVEVIPAWEGQLEATEWDLDETSEDFGKPIMYTYRETGIGSSDVMKRREFTVHPDRVVVWSKDGTLYGESALTAGYNDLVDMEKVKGAGGEGFWKNARSAQILQIDKEARLENMAAAMGVPVAELADKMDEQVEDFQKGFDSMLMLQGIEAKPNSVTLPQPEQFWMGPLQSFAASWCIPVKILVGSQSGERASTEDADEWAKTNKSRRTNSTIPNIEAVVERLVLVGVLSDDDWQVVWSDLTESSIGDKIDRATKMAQINKTQADSGGLEVVFTEDEIRETVGMEPLSDDDALREPEDNEEDPVVPPIPPPPTDGEVEDAPEE